MTKTTVAEMAFKLGLLNSNPIVKEALEKEKEQIKNVFEHCWNHPNWNGEYDIKDMNDYINQKTNKTNTMNKELSGTISSQGSNGVLNIPNGSNNTGTSVQYPKCSKCNKQKLNLHPFDVYYCSDSLFCACNESVRKSDLDILQDEVKSLTKRVDKLIKQQNK